MIWVSGFATVCAILVYGKARPTRHASYLASLGGYTARKAKVCYNKSKL